MASHGYSRSSSLASSLTASYRSTGKEGEGEGEERTKLTGKQKLILFFLCLTNYSGILLYSVIAPFFPGEASDKGVNQTIIGLIFGIYELVTFLASPVFGKLAAGIGFKFVFVSGVYVCAACSILFGFVDRSPDGSAFIVICFAVRIAEGIATAAFMTAGFAIASIVFADRKSFVMGLMETCLCLGLMSGPPIGGVLYEFGGFSLPFIVVGVVLLICGTLSWLLFPSITLSSESAGASLFQLLQIPGVSLCVACVCTASLTVGFIEPTLELHIRQFNLTPSLVGAFFLCLTGAYAAAAPFWGWLADRRVVDPKYMMLFGAWLGLISLNLVGPAEFFPIDTELWLVGVALAIMAFGIEAMYVPPFTESFMEASSNGFPDNFATNSLIAGLFAASFHFGAFLGPTVGGPLVQYLGFRAAASYISLTHILMGVLLTVMIIRKGKMKKMDEEKGKNRREQKRERRREKKGVDESYPLITSD